jgi:hypothetical protein
LQNEAGQDGYDCYDNKQLNQGKAVRGIWVAIGAEGAWGFQ